MNFYKRSGNTVAKLFCSTLCGSPAFNRLSHSDVRSLQIGLRGTISNKGTSFKFYVAFRPKSGSWDEMGSRRDNVEPTN